MGKFIIENVLIEKSDKDIKTGEKYSLSEGFNLICGNNEAGKSSLMNFIKQSFFKTKGIDTGKIYFKINDQKYRADIKDTRAVDTRCKIYDEFDSTCDYSVIEKNIKQKYFEEGFTINLDDLMKIQNKQTEEFINIIKDPSGDKLNIFLEKINNNIALNLSLDGKLKKNAKEIIDKITALNIKIRELSNKENEYNNAINTITVLSKEINEILNKEEYIKGVKETSKLELSQKELINEKIESENTFNKQLFEDKERYFELIQDIGKFNSNIEIIERCNQKLQVAKSKILQDKTRLNIECGVSISDEIISQLSIDNEKIHKIKELIEESNQIVLDIKHDEEKIEELETSLLRLKCEIETILKNGEEKYNFEEFETLIKDIEEGLRQYHFISSEIDNVDKENILNASEINTNKKLQILLGILLFVTVLCAVVSFLQKIQTAGIFSILMAILTLAGYSALKIGSYTDRQDDEKTRKYEQRNLILDSLKEKIKPYYSEINNIESSYLPIKLDSIKQEFQTKLNEFRTFNNVVLKNASDRNFTEERLLAVKAKISNSYARLNTIKEEITNLADKNIADKDISGKIYIEAIEIIKSIKDTLIDKSQIDIELNQTIECNNIILNKIKTFIFENNVNISISEDINETIMELKRSYEKNNIVKQHIDALEAQIMSINQQINKIKENINQVQDFEINDIEIQQNELFVAKEEKIKQRKEAEFKKRELEKIEGISELKTERNILIEEYRALIKNLFIDKMTLELTSIAKREFDKTQPDLINAQKYLSILTDNKYSKINLELQELANDEGSKIKKWEHLSRGTKEQLYLALRLGYASNYSKDKTTLEPNGKADLPIIIDDAFVNFDAKRTKNALRCLCEFSKTNQVLFFTCHIESITKMLNEIGGENINIIQL